MRRVVFSPNKIVCEYVSASYHLPGAYVDSFPCPHCSYKDKAVCTYFVEVFHFVNVHSPNICATVSLSGQPSKQSQASLQHLKHSGCRVEVEPTKGCPNAPLAVDHSPRVVLHIATDVFIEVLCFLLRSELDRMQLVSLRWSNVIGGAVRSLQQRRSFSMFIKFYGESSGMLSVHFFRSIHSGQCRQTLRVLTTRGLLHALNAVLLHLRNAFVKSVQPSFRDHVPPPSPPREMRVDVPFPARIEWLKSLLRFMPPNSEIGSWCVSDDDIEFELLSLAHCALGPHGKLDCVQRLKLGLFDRDVTWAQLAGVLNHPSIRVFSEISVSTTRVAIDTSGLRDILSSWQSLKLYLFVSGFIVPLDALLALPARIIQDFMALRDLNRFVAEFSLHVQKFRSVPFSEMPSVHQATNLRKRFRCRLKGEDTVVRISLYENRAVRGYLSVVTFDYFHRTVLFLNGNVSLAELKQTLQRRDIVY